MQNNKVIHPRRSLERNVEKVLTQVPLSLLVLTTLVGSLIVIGFWQFVSANLWIMNHAELSGLLAISFVIGPITTFCTFACCLSVYFTGWRHAWYVVPTIVLGTSASVINLLFFVYYIAPGC